MGVGNTERAKYGLMHFQVFPALFEVSEPAKMDWEGRPVTMAGPEHHLAFLDHTLSEGALKYPHFIDEKTEGWDHSEVQESGTFSCLHCLAWILAKEAVGRGVSRVLISHTGSPEFHP